MRDLARDITDAEHAAIQAALDELVTGGSCAGVDKEGAPFAVAFVVHATSADEARAAGHRYMRVTLDAARVAVGDEISVQEETPSLAQLRTRI